MDEKKRNENISKTLKGLNMINHIRSAWMKKKRALVCLIQMASLPLDTWIRLIGWMAIGILIYFAYSIKHSKARKNAAEQK